MTNTSPPSPEPSPTAAQLRFQRAEQVFDAACKVPPGAARDALVAQACAGDEDLLAEVRAWLVAHEEWESEQPGSSTAVSVAARAWEAAQAEPDEAPSVIGRYRVMGLIGAGGMGTVYEAEQDDPARTVALKLLHPEFDSEALQQRFRSEAEILARLNHRSIAHVYDFGEIETQLGTRLFIAMERVRGVPLQQYTAQHGLSRDQTLRLLLSIAEAVRHAHRHGIIHRDLKPSNILVREDGTPVLLDFGVARRMEEVAGLTRSGHIVGTLRYMSPEQAAGEVVDARTDVFALGMIGYELLTGQHPRPTSTPPAGERVSTVPRLSSLDPTLRGDLTIIFAKALEQEPERRYQDVDSFVEDLRRYLAAEPILARPPSTLYQARMFVRRHLVPTVMGLMAAIALLVGLVVSLQAASREEAQRMRADGMARDAEHAAYIANIKAAAADIDAMDVVSARDILLGLPESKRGWEWRYLLQRLDRSTQFLPWERAMLGDARQQIVATVSLDAAGRLDGLVMASTPATEAALRDPTRAFSVRLPGESRTTRVRLAQLRVLGADGTQRIVPRSPTRTRLSVPGHGATWVRSRTSLTLHRSATDDSPLEHLQGTELYDAEIDKSGHVLAACGRDHGVRLYDARTGAALGMLRGHLRPVVRLVFDAGGQRLATADTMGNIIIWDVTRRIALHKLLGHEGLVHEVRFLDASRLISLGVDGVRLWDLVAAEALRELRHPQAPQGRFIYDLSLSGDGRRVCSTNFRGELEVTSLPVGDVLFASRVPTIFRIPKHLCTRSSSDSAWFGVGEGVLSVFHAETGARAWAPPTDEFIGGFAFDSARSRVVAVGEEHLLAFDLRDGKQTILATHERPTRSCRLDLASSGLRVVVSAGHVLTAHDAVSGKRLWRYESPDESPVLDIVWSPDGGTVALTSSDGVIRLLDGEAGTLRRELRGHQTSVFALAFSPDGRRLASGARDGTVRFWDPASGLTTLVLRAHSDYVHALAFDPTGDTLLSGSGDGTVRTWSIRPLSTRVAQRVAELAARARLLPLVQARLQAVGPEQAWGSLEQALPPADHDLARDVLLLESAKAEPK